MFNARATSLLLLLALLLTPLTARAQLEALANAVRDTSESEKAEEEFHYNPADRVEFYYEEDEVTKAIRRVPMPAPDYDARKKTEIEDRWKPFFKGLIESQGRLGGGAGAGRFGGGAMPGAMGPGAMPGVAAPEVGAAGEAEEEEDEADDLTATGGIPPIVQEMLEELDIPEDRANMLIQMSAQESQWLNYSEAATNDFIRRMAEWSFFYQQLDRWNRFVADSVLRQDLRESAQLSYDPKEDVQNLEKIRTALQDQARQLNEDQRNVYLEMVDRVTEDRKGQARYEQWLAKREESLMAFADQWAASHDDQTLDLESGLYLVRPLDDSRPTMSDQETEMPGRRLPQDRILLEVPTDGELTPYDLLQSDGTLKTQ